MKDIEFGMFVSETRYKSFLTIPECSTSAWLSIFVWNINFFISKMTGNYYAGTTRTFRSSVFGVRRIRVSINLSGVGVAVKWAIKYFKIIKENEDEVAMAYAIQVISHEYLHGAISAVLNKREYGHVGEEKIVERMTSWDNLDLKFVGINISGSC